MFGKKQKQPSPMQGVQALGRSVAIWDPEKQKKKPQEQPSLLTILQGRVLDRNIGGY